MDEAAITQYILKTFAGVETAATGGYTFFFVGPDRRMPFATLATADTEFDRASHLDRPSVFRLNVGVSRETYGRLFGTHPAPPGAAAIVETGHDFTALDVLLPHPVYAPQSWVCVLNPGATTWEHVRPLLEEAYGRAAERQVRRRG